jgi:predicted MFS family arabinose efflux permease
LSDSLPRVLRPLLLGNFVVGCGVMILPATLPEISASLAVTVPQAGQLVTASSLVVALGAPLLAALVAGWDRRRLLAASMLWFGLLHLVCAAMPDLHSLMLARILAMVAPAIYTPQAAASVALLVPLEQRGRAITFVFLGFSAASVLGMPIAAFVGGTFGWRAAFALIGLLALVNALWIWRTMPDGVRPQPLSLAAWGQTLRSPALTSCLAVTLLFGSAQFVLYAYFAPYLKLQVGFSTTQLSLLLMWFGAFGLLGNALMSRAIDRIGPSRSVMCSLVLACVSLLLWPLGTSLPLVAAVVTPWAFGYFACNSAQQARLAGIAPKLAPASIALNTSAIYAGQGIGAAIGGALIAQGLWDSLHWGALIGMLCAMGMSLYASRMAAPRRCELN